MPDIINNVINGTYSASGHNIYVCELAPFESPYLYNQQLKSFGGFRIAKNDTGSRSHLWDLYLLSASMQNRATHSSGNYFYKRFNTTDYKPLFCSDFNDNAGENVYRPVENFSGLSVLNHPVYNQYQYSGSFSFSPILSVTSYNAQLSAETILYRASYMPLYPLLFCSSIPTHKSFGPAFISNFSISVDGTNTLGDVEINCNVVGGRSVISPEGVTTTRPITQANYIRMKPVNPSDPQNYEINNFREKYRAVNLSDCAFYQGLFTGNYAFDNFKKAVLNGNNSNTMPIYKIVSMNLNISQGVSFSYTYPGYSYGNKLIDFYDVVGPRFASLSNRVVTGSIKLFSPQNYSFVNFNASSLTLFFGSIFFYTMKNVDWQQPIITISPGTGYFIEYKFTVRLTEVTAFNGFLNDRVSEFL